MRHRNILTFVFGLLIVPALVLGTQFAYARSDIDQLQAKISDRNNKLQDIAREIDKYKAAIKEVGAEKDTLQKAINTLELGRKKLQADIKYTENKISGTDLEISKLNLEIKNSKNDIEKNKNVIATILRSLSYEDNDTLIELVLRNETLSSFWNEVENLETVRDSINKQVKTLISLKKLLETKHENEKGKRNNLVDLKVQYDGQQAVLKNNKLEKGVLLKETKNKESNYQILLKEKASSRDKLLAEVRDIESQIKFILDPNTIPTPGTIVFRWPLNPPVYITQNFGYTKFALSGAYGGSKHNGMDMGAPVGTKIYAPLSGTVRMVGNTDLIPGCYSWGKWALIDHQNGLSSMFAHMSQVTVVPGQKLNTGDVVGYVGSTGYSTGPHLHYTLYVKDAVKVMQFNQFKSVTGCGAALSPFASIDAYLNPRDFLPPL